MAAAAARKGGAGQGRRTHEPKTSSATATARIASFLLPVLSAAIIICAVAALVVVGLNGPARLEALRALGVRIALDDFGTGYSSLNYLQKFPFDRLKIDRAFVASLGSSGNTGTIIQSIVVLGHALGMKVLAEGVENDEQRVLLRLAGCDEMQGYLFARPGPAAEIDRLLARPLRSASA